MKLMVYTVILCVAALCGQSLESSQKPEDKTFRVLYVRGALCAVVVRLKPQEKPQSSQQSLTGAKPILAPTIKNEVPTVPSKEASEGKLCQCIGCTKYGPIKKTRTSI